MLHIKGIVIRSFVRQSIRFIKLHCYVCYQPCLRVLWCITWQLYHLVKTFPFQYTISENFANIPPIYNRPETELLTEKDSYYSHLFRIF